MSTYRAGSIHGSIDRKPFSKQKDYIIAQVAFGKFVIELYRVHSLSLARNKEAFRNVLEKLQKVMQDFKADIELQFSNPFPEGFAVIKIYEGKNIDSRLLAEVSDDKVTLYLV